MENGRKHYKKVLFCDLDGTLINTIFGKDFPIGCYDMAFKWEVLDAIKAYNPEVVVIISNQGGIEAGYVNYRFFVNKITWVSSVIAEYCKCDCIYDYTPSNDPNNIKRKPNPGMINNFINSKCDINNMDLVMIGDRPEDKGCADNARVKYYDVKEFVSLFENIDKIN